jgi:hypothetical protein
LSSTENLVIESESAIKTIGLITLAVLVLTAAILLTTGTETVVSEEDNMDPEARRILAEMCTLLSTAQEFSYRNDSFDEELLASGQKVQVAQRAEVVIRRPDRFWVELINAKNHRRAFYDGTNVTVLSMNENMYASVPVRDNIDSTMYFLIDEYGLSLPMSDFFYSSPFDVLTEKIDGGYYLGRQMIQGVQTHHLAFSQETIDWQIWVEDGKEMVPRRFVITFKADENCTQYVANLSNWDFEPLVSDHLFEFESPDGAVEIEFVTRD